LSRIFYDVSIQLDRRFTRRGRARVGFGTGFLASRAASSGEIVVRNSAVPGGGVTEW
jgi:hypothetical protein